jgi:hypothetical protein
MAKQKSGITVLIIHQDTKHILTYKEDLHSSDESITLLEQLCDSSSDN